MLPERLDEITSKHTAVKTGSVKHGMPVQAYHNLHLLDNRLRLHSGSIHVAVERRKMCAGHAHQPEGFHVRHLNIRKASMSERLNSKASDEKTLGQQATRRSAT